MRITLMNVDDHDDIFVVETNNLDHTEAVDARGQAWQLTGEAPAGELWREKVSANWKGQAEEAVRL